MHQCRIYTTAAGSAAPEAPRALRCNNSSHASPTDSPSHRAKGDPVHRLMHSLPLSSNTQPHLPVSLAGRTAWCITACQSAQSSNLYKNASPPHARWAAPGTWHCRAFWTTHGRALHCDTNKQGTYTFAPALQPDRPGHSRAMRSHASRRFSTSEPLCIPDCLTIGASLVHLAGQSQCT